MKQSRPMNQPSNRAEHWTTLWRSGVLHSCGHGLAGNYDGEIARFWHSQLSPLPAGARVVDLGTGNGPLLLLARSLRPDLELHGVDLAMISPASSRSDDYQGIHFHPGCDMSQLPFADGSVDLFISQFGFDYGPHPETEIGLQRKLRSSGGLALLLHAEQSQVCRNTQIQLDNAGLLRPGGLLEAASAMACMLIDTPLAQRHRLANEPANESIRLHFNDLAGRALEQAGRHPDATVLLDAIRCVRDAMQLATQGNPQAMLVLGKGAERARAQLQRLLDLQDAVLDCTQLQALTTLLTCHGLHCRLQPLHYDGQLMATSLLATASTRS